VRFLGEQQGLIVATAAMTLVIFLLCEVLPKAVAAQHPQRIAYSVALPLYMVHQALRPLHILYDRLISPLVTTIAGRSEGTPTSTAEDILSLARGVQTEASGTPLAIITAAASASETTVSDIMVPRTEIVAFPVDTNPPELLDKLLEERYTRVPVYEESIDSILGLVHLKDLALAVRHDENNLRKIVKPVIRVPERKPILPMLADMQRAFVHVAIVKDEFNVTLGMVTQEDILEELVGEIRDEFDREELNAIQRIDDQRVLAFGRVKVQDFSRETGWNVPAERGDTLAGLVFNKLGRGPKTGESVTIGAYTLTVADISGSRVTQVEVTREGDGDNREEIVEG
jgi:putative hemolysin